MRLGRLALALAAATVLAGSAHAANGSFLGFQTQSADPINVTSDTLEVYDEGAQRISIFSGKVKVVRGPTTMTAATMKLFSSTAAGATSGFTRIEADGKINVTSEGQTLTGDKAVVDNIANTITVTGNVVMSQGGSVIAGDRLVVDMITGRVKVEQSKGQQIRGVFAPGDVNMAGPSAGGQ
jgi:lipopolysaccharide export system protein LptA